MKKSKKVIVLLMTVIMLIQIFLSSGMVFGSSAATNSSTTDNTSESSIVVSDEVKGKGSTVKNGKDATHSDKGKKKSNIIVKYKDVTKAEASKNKFTAKKPKSKIASKKQIKRFKMEALQISSDEDISDIINELQSDPNIEYVQPDYVLDAYLIPSDTSYSEQWGLSNNGQTVNGQTGTSEVDIDAVNAWDITTGSNEVTVGIVDTGVDISHPDISNNIYVNIKEELDGVDNDGNGYVDDVNGFDFTNKDSSVFDSASQDKHATHVAGIIASELNNGGITGVSPNVKILPLKFINGNTGYTSDAISAISYGMSMGVSIFNCSWGGNQENEALKDIMANSNALFICAAGNAGQNVDVNPVYPACYRLPNVISVGAIDNRGELASFSNYGSKVQIAAPGGGILSTLPGSDYGLMSGTSMAAPFVSGVAALLKSKYPTMSPPEIKTRILNNVTKEQNLVGKVATSGRLNVSAALLNNPPSDTAQPTLEPTPTAINKSKDPDPVYDTSASGNNKVVKPLVEKSNLFIDAVVDKGISKMSSGENGIDNLSINRVKQNYITVTWTTSVLTNAELCYGSTESVEQSYKVDELTTKHQITINEENVNYYKVKSTAQDGTVFQTEVRAVSDDITNLGGTAPTAVDITGTEDSQNNVQEVSVMSYISDNGANHSFAAAQMISEGTVFGTEAADEYDFYKINAESGKTYSFGLRGMAAGEDYDIYLYNSPDINSLIAYSVNGSNYDENITYTATFTGTYYIAVLPYSVNITSAHNNYQLMVYSADNTPDRFEPNDSKETAIPMTNDIAVNATLNISTDEDWFVLDATKTGKLNVTMKDLPYDCDYDMTIYDSTGAYVGGSYANANQDEKYTGTISNTGKYFIRIYAYSGFNASDSYELKAGVYTMDSYEPNDDLYSLLNNQPSINIGSCINATLDNIDDTDCFKFNIDRSTNVGVRLQNIPTGMDYDMVIYSYNSSNSCFVEVANSNYGSNSDETVISQLVAGNYYIKIYSCYGSSDIQSYKLSLTDENADVGIIKMDFDKTYAEVGDIITATVRVGNINYLAGYQVNIKYDPVVVQPVDDNQQVYSVRTMPTGGNIIKNSDYSPVSIALNNVDNGILNFSAGYLDGVTYKQSGMAESSGILGIIKFKVLKSNQIQIKFDVCEIMPKSSTGVYLFDWDGNEIISGFTIQQPQIINDSLPVNSQTVENSYIQEKPQTVEGNSIEENPELSVMAASSYKVYGYVGVNFSYSNSNVRKGFKVEIDGTSLSTTTDTEGYFVIPNVPMTTNGSTYTIKISKDNYLARFINKVVVDSDTALGKVSSIKMWPGDIKGTMDGYVNIADIMNVARSFNTSTTAGNYNKDCDIDMNNAINIADVIAIISSFNKSSSSYDVVTVIHDPTVTLDSPSNGSIYTVGQTISIKATGRHCDHIGLFINNTFIIEQPGNQFSYNYTIPSTGSFSICVKGRDVPGSSGGMLVTSQTVTVQGTSNSIPVSTYIKTGLVTKATTNQNVGNMTFTRITGDNDITYINININAGTLQINDTFNAQNLKEKMLKSDSDYESGSYNEWYMARNSKNEVLQWLAYDMSINNIQADSPEFYALWYEDFKMWCNGYEALMQVVGGIFAYAMVKNLALSSYESGVVALETQGISLNARTGFKLSNGIPQGTSSMKTVRLISTGEKVANIIDELKQLTFSTGNEYAVVKLGNGERAIVSGGTNGIFFKEGEVSLIYVHTHPYQYNATGPSVGDLNALEILGQKSSYLIERGTVEKFYVNKP